MTRGRDLFTIVAFFSYRRGVTCPGSDTQGLRLSFLPMAGFDVVRTRMLVLDLNSWLDGIYFHRPRWLLVRQNALLVMYYLQIRR